MLSIWTASAQGRLQVSAVFDGKVVPEKQMKETFIQGGQLQPYNLKQYRSVSLTGDDAILAEVSRRVLADAETATDQEVHYQGGNLIYAILTFEGANHNNRFICYQCVSKNGSNAITLVYMHGPATLDDRKKLFKSK